MSASRKALRAGVRTALEALPALSSCTSVKAWRFPRDAEDLPAYTVLTPDERGELLTGGENVRAVDLVVALKMQGDEEIEDDLDDYADAIEACVISTFDEWDPILPLFQMTRVRTSVEEGGELRVGLLEVHFAVQRFADEGEQP